MKTSFLFLTIGVSKAFTASYHKAPRLQHVVKMSTEDEHDIVPATSAFRDIDVDMDRVKDCAEHFGKCSVTEIRELKNDLHDKRIQNVVFGTSPNPETLYEEKIFEEELDLQLSLLQDEVPESYLFPEVEEEMEDLPHLKDGTAAASVQETIDKENKILLFEELAEEGVIESLAICGFLGLMMFAPQAVFH